VLQSCTRSPTFVSKVSLGDVIWEFALKEIRLASLSRPNDVIFKSVLNSQAIHRHIVTCSKFTQKQPQDLTIYNQGILAWVRGIINQSINVVISAPEPEIVPDDVSRMNVQHNFSADWSFIRTPNSSKDVLQKARVAGIARVLTECSDVDIRFEQPQFRSLPTQAKSWYQQHQPKNTSEFVKDKRNLQQNSRNSNTLQIREHANTGFSI